MQNSAPTRSSLVRLALLTVLAVLATLIVGATQARANAVLQDCNDNYQIDGKYTKQQLLDALQEVRTDVAEYSVCQDAINAALTQKLTKSGSKGGGKSGQSGKSLKTASAEDLTTAKQREKIRDQVEDEANDAKGGPAGDGPIDAVTNPAIRTASGNTLASDNAPGVPWILIIASLGLLLFLGVELAGRFGKMPHVTKHLPRIGRGDR